MQKQYFVKFVNLRHSMLKVAGDEQMHGLSGSITFYEIRI